MIRDKTFAQHQAERHKAAQDRVLAAVEKDLWVGSTFFDAAFYAINYGVKNTEARAAISKVLTDAGKIFVQKQSTFTIKGE